MTAARCEIETLLERVREGGIIEFDTSVCVQCLRVVQDNILLYSRVRAHTQSQGRRESLFRSDRVMVTEARYASRRGMKCFLPHVAAAAAGGKNGTIFYHEPMTEKGTSDRIRGGTKGRQAGKQRGRASNAEDTILDWYELDVQSREVRR